MAHNVVRIEDFNTGGAVERIRRHEGTGMLKVRGTKTKELSRYISRRRDRQVAGRSKSHVSCSSIMQAGIRREADKVGTTAL